MEYENKFASLGKGNAALTTGIIGTAGVGLGLLNGLMGNGGILGGYGAGNGGGCAGNMYAGAMIANGYTKYDAAKDSEIAALKMDKALLESTVYTNGQMNDVRNYFEDKLDGVNRRLAEMAVTEQATKDSFLLLQQTMASDKAELFCALGRERDERCAGDNAIVNYVNATFYPKMVADVTTGATTTAQTVYNPLPICNCKCGG